MGVQKYRPALKLDIIELHAKGYSLATIAETIGITYRCLCYWIKKYDLREPMDKAKEEYNRQLIDSGLEKLAAGAKDTEEVEKFTYTRKAKRKVIDDEGNIIEEIYIQPVEKTVKRKVKAPDSKAIEILARKYAKEFDPKSEERELTTNILEGFTMRQLQEARKNNPIDSGASIEAEFTELSSDGTVDS